MRLAWLVLAAVVAAGSAAATDAEWDGWRTGDLVFQEAPGPSSEAVRSATGSRLTHVGIVRQTGGGPHVVEATEAGGVRETSIDEFVERGVGRRYAVYRLRGLTRERAFVPPRAAWDHHGRAYDPFFRPDPEAFYGAELVRHAFRAIGVALGRPARLGDLRIDTPEGRATFLSGWRDHPDCRAAGLDRAACLALIRGQAVVMPSAIAEDPRLELVFSTFDGSP